MVNLFYGNKNFLQNACFIDPHTYIRTCIHKITTWVEHKWIEGWKLMWVDEIGEQYIERFTTTCTQCCYSYEHIYIQQFSIVRLQDTNLLIPSSDWSIKYLLELLLTFFRFSYFFSLICILRKVLLYKIRGGKHILTNRKHTIYHSHQHLLASKFGNDM